MLDQLKKSIERLREINELLKKFEQNIDWNESD